MTIRTVTLSTGFDHDVVVDDLAPGEVGRVLSWTTVAAGKGVNAARAAAAFGVETVAYALVGRHEEQWFTELARRSGCECVTVAVDQPTRDNLTLRIGGVGVRSAHAAGPRFTDVDEAIIGRLVDRVCSEVVPGDVVTLNGSLPSGARSSIWAEASLRLRDLGATVIADVQGAALSNLVRGGSAWAVTPNGQEVRALLIASEVSQSDSMDTALRGVRAMHRNGIEQPIVTCAADGVLHALGGDIVQSRCPVDAARMEVGAGDAFVGGLCVALASRHSGGTDPVWMGLATASAHVAGFAGEALRAAAMERLERITSTVIAPTT